MGQAASSNNVMNLVAKGFINGIWLGVKTMWVNWWPFIVVFFVVVIIGIVLQILMLRNSGHNKLSPGFNRLVGSLTYTIIFILIITIAYLIWGPKIIDEIWFVIFGAMAFLSTHIFLRLIGFWYY